jgi:hypothetical protein
VWSIYNHSDTRERVQPWLPVQNVFEQMTRDRVDFMCRMPALQHESLARLRTLAGTPYKFANPVDPSRLKGAWFRFQPLSLSSENPVSKFCSFKYQLVPATPWRCT